MTLIALLATAALAADVDADGYDAAVDCNDLRPDVNPGATEVCDRRNVDEDCDGVADDADPTVTRRSAWYEDLDGDGYAGARVAFQCEGPPGTLKGSRSTPDCDDQNPEVWNGYVLWYPDADGDGFHSGTGWVQACYPPAPTGWMLDNGTQGDCRDGDATIYPGAAEICGDGVDQDCGDGDAVCAWWDARIVGSTAGEGFGRHVAVVGDTSGDGDADVWVTEAIGKAVRLYDGPIVGELDQASFSVELRADVPGNDYLDTLAPAGDVNRDGLDDLVLGANGKDNGLRNATGEVYLVLGGTTGSARVSSVARTILTNTGSGDLMGSNVAVGDWSGDGLPEVFASLPSDTTTASNQGAVLVGSLLRPGRFDFEASASAKILGTGADSRLSEGTLLVGDTDDDGVADLVLSSYDGNDLYVFRHDPTGTVSASTADTSFAWRQGLMYGKAIADLDGDGETDLAVVQHGFEGRLLIAPGWASGPDFEAVSTASVTSGGVDVAPISATVADFDGDGFEDLAVGAAQYVTNDDNGVYVLAGPFVGARDLSTAERVLQGEHDDDDTTNPSAGDLDGDGVPDLVVGSPRWFYRTPVVAGQVYVVNGPLF